MDWISERKVVLKRQAIDFIQTMDYKNRKKILNRILEYRKIDLFAPNIKKLKSGKNDKLYRERILGTCRIVFTFEKTDEEKIVKILRIRNRKNVYRGIQENDKSVGSRGREAEVVKDELITEDEDTEDDRDLESYEEEVEYYCPIYIDEEVWNKYIFNSYLQYPRLASEQKAIIEEYANKKFVFIQGGPGTGKTIMAVYMAKLWLEDDNTLVYFIAPRGLIDDVKKYDDIKKICDQDKPLNLLTMPKFINKYRSCEFLKYNIASLSKVIEAIKKQYNFSTVDERVGKIFIGYVLDDESGEQVKDICYKENEELINKLNKKEKKNGVNKYLKNKKLITIVEAAQQVKKKSFNQNEEYKKINIIIDEVQDLTLIELSTIRKLIERWEKKGKVVKCWLLGDLNQRIMPSGFNWDLAKANIFEYNERVIELNKNYRNTKIIQKFANNIFDLRPQPRDTRLRPIPPEAEKCIFRGDKIRAIVLENEKETKKVVDRIISKYSNSENEETYYLRERLARSIKIIYNNKKIGIRDRSNVILLNGKNAKGREFTSCIIYFIINNNNGEIDYNEITNWYTIITRARLRLTVIMTRKEKEILERKIGEIEDVIWLDKDNFVNQIDWITKVGGDIDLGENPKDIIEKLYVGINDTFPYFDSYEIIESYREKEEILEEWEKIMKENIRRTNKDMLNKYLNKIDEMVKSEYNKFRLKNLVERANRDLITAKITANEMRKYNNEEYIEEYKRIMMDIADEYGRIGYDLESKRIKYYLEKNKKENGSILEKILTEEPTKDTKRLLIKEMKERARRVKEEATK